LAVAIIASLSCPPVIDKMFISEIIGVIKNELNMGNNVKLIIITSIMAIIFFSQIS
jgi:hypothetical protein